MNQLKVNQQQTIIALYQQGWSKRKIARELGVDRLTVRRYLAADPKSPTNRRTGSAGGSRPDSLCQPHQAAIEAALRAGLSVQRIYSS